jgi:single-stranded DNA-binding protein
MIEATLTGNILTPVQQRSVVVKGENRRVTELLVLDDVYRRTGEETVQDEEKTSPVVVSIWSEDLGDRCMNLLHVGMRVVIRGDLHLHKWTPNETQAANGKVAQAGMRLSATSVALALNRVEAVKMRQRVERSDASESGY